VLQFEVYSFRAFLILTALFAIFYVNRSIRIPTTLDVSRTSSRFKNGVLSVHVEKFPPEKNYIQRKVVD
jgi:HSP20 family molecular chaperone IbpA